MIIDMHAHTSRRKLWNFHTQETDIKDIRSLAEKFGIDKIYLMATYFPLKKSGLHNLELLERVRDDKLFGCFASLDLEKDGEPLQIAISWLRYLAQEKLVDGFKLYPGYQKFFLSDIKCHSIYALAEEFGLPVAIHMGELHHCCPEESRNKETFRCGRKNCPLDERGQLSEPKQLALAAKNFPNVNFIACHLANPFFEEMRQAMSENLNIYTDFSGQFVSGSAEDTPEYRVKIVEKIKKFLDLPLGVLRMMFATDFPIQSYQDTFDLLEALNLKPIAKEMILSGNALRILPQKG